MDQTYIYNILREIVEQLGQEDGSLTALPPKPDPGRTLSDLGLDLTSLPEIKNQFRARLGGKEIQWDFLFDPMQINTVTLEELLSATIQSITGKIKEPIIVYVDDEEENLFIFKRKYGKRMRLVTFSDSLEALEYIRKNDEVRVVITDEVMPNMTGGVLCDEIHKVKPFMGVILITGNPNSDEDLMYNSLKRNRFYEFINKPVDLAGKGEEYFNMIQSLAFFGRG